MPHIIVKLYPGRTEEQKQNIVSKVTEAIKESANVPDESISIGIEEISKELWEEQVYKPDILAKKDTIYKKPGYIPK